MDWQTWVVIALVAGAAWYLARRSIAALRGRGGGCSGCPSHNTREDPMRPIRRPLVTLQPGPRAKAKNESH